MTAVDARAPGGCSDRADISGVSKHAEEQSAMVIAEDKSESSFSAPVLGE